MNTQTKLSPINAERFNTAEQMWFWFLYSRQVRNGFSAQKLSGGKRVCELLDIETLITKLYLTGALTNDQLGVLKEFGDKRRPPHQHIWSENAAAALWRDAMETIGTAAVKKGWIE